MHLPLTKARIGLAAGAIGAAGALTFVAAAAGAPSDSTTNVRNTSSSDEAPGDISGPCDEAEHANDPRCDGVTVTDPNPPAAAAPAAGSTSAGTHSLPTPGGTVTYRSNGSSLTLVTAMPANGWRVEVEQRTDREIELDFRAGTRRVQVNVEIEDGQVRERVRLRDDADGTDVRIENGVVVEDDRGDDGAGHDIGDDHGDDGAGHDVGDDHGDDGAGHDVGDDHGDDGAGHDVGDDHGGTAGTSGSGSGSDDSGSGSGSDDSGSGSDSSGSGSSGSSHSGGSDDSGSGSSGHG